jgi:peptidoglycan/xylan/chitin deacetylase (PgdA/CDA1 family)
MKIILKADDLAGYPGKNKIIPKRWQRFVDLIEKYKIKATIGIIGNSLLFNDEGYFEWVKKYDKLGFIEFWNHGFLHRQFSFDNENYQEFKETTIEYQLQLIEYTNKLAKEKLNIEFKTFGAPYNAIDENTSKALNKTNLTHWFFGLDSFKGINLSNRLDIEYPVHIINENYFKDSFKKVKKDYFVLQVHPNNWNENSFIEFENVIQFLLEQNCKFILAKEYK